MTTRTQAQSLLDLFGDDPRPRKGEHIMPADAQAVACKSCGMPIVWTHTAAGRALPLSVATVEERDRERFALSHFVDCPHGRDWSRR